MRDVLLTRVPAILAKEIYALAAIAAAVFQVVAEVNGGPSALRLGSRLARASSGVLNVDLELRTSEGRDLADGADLLPAVGNEHLEPNLDVLELFAGVGIEKRKSGATTQMAIAYRASRHAVPVLAIKPAATHDLAPKRLND